jgi:hypothetical protein
VNYETLRFVTSTPTLVVIPNAAYESAVIANLNTTGQSAQVPFYNMPQELLRTVRLGLQKCRC